MRRERDRRSMRRGSAPSLASLSPFIWLEPNALDTLSGGRVANAFDLSGNLRHGVQGTAGNQPLLVAGAGPGGRDCWRFVPARTDFLSIAHDAGIAGLAWTFFVVVKKAAANGLLFSKAVGNAPRPFDFFTVGASALAGELAGVATVSDSAWHISGARRDPAGTGTAQVFRDKATDSTGATTPLPNTGTPAIRIGLRDDGALALDGDIACVCAWNRALSDAEVTQVNAYFTARFGL
jgi:hypothetical protein